MLKISAENSMRETVRVYWRQFAESATAFAHRYQSDLFLRTEIHIVALEIAYAAFIVLLAIGALVVLYQEIVGGVMAAMATALTTATPISAEAIITQLEAARTREIVGISILIFGAAIVFAYLISRLALMPARNALVAQKQFIGNIAHELRTPLSIIKANTEIRLIDSALSTQAKSIHEDNLEELDRISDIINNLLSLNTLIQPERMPFTNVDIVKIAERAAGRLEPLLRKKPVKIRIKSGKARATWGNISALEQIVMNLLRNAIHHTSKGEILISIGPTAQGLIEFSIRDSGTGISKEDLARIFEPFYRGDRARTRTGGAGSGLGLAIVSELVKLHHGRISVRSTAGEGTTVSVVLPPSRTGAIPKAKPVIDPHEVSVDFGRNPPTSSS